MLVIMTDNRGVLRNYFHGKGINIRIYFTVLHHLQEIKEMQRV